MTFRVSVQADIKSATRHLNQLQKREIPFATKTALNNTAFNLKGALTKSMPRHMQNPIGWTLRGMRVKKSTKRSLFAEVFIAPSQRKYLERIIFSSSGQKRVVPGRGSPNKHGNLSRNYVNVRRSRRGFFVGKAGRKQQAGLWEKSAAGLELHAAFESSTQHGASWPYFEIANRFVRANFKREFDKALKYAIATSNKK